MDYKYLKTKHKGTVVYIEPNHFTEYNITHNTNVETAVPLEDLSIYCDLEVEIFDRMGEKAKSFFRVEMAGTKAEKDAVSINDDDVKLGYFMQGSPYGNVNSLTTRYTDIGYREISKGEGTIEMFGINSINISYDSWVCPQVKIQFTDVRGISLFTAQELGHNTMSCGDGMTGLSTDDSRAIASFFSCFFRFPYPRFKLYVKGFYGEPVAYDLAISNVDTDFDAHTGNFNLNVDFIGYKFGILNDLTMTSLAAAVSCQDSGDIGQAYWDSQVKAGHFTHNGDALLKVGDIAKMYEEYSRALSAAKEQIDEEMAEKEEANDTNSALSELLNAYMQTVNDTAIELTKEVRDYYNGIYDQLSNLSEADRASGHVYTAFGNKILSSEDWQGDSGFCKSMQNKINSLIVASNDGYKITWCIPDFAHIQFENKNTVKPIFSVASHIHKKDNQWRSEALKDYGSNEVFSTNMKNGHYLVPFSGNSWTGYISRQPSLTADTVINGTKYCGYHHLNNSGRTNIAIAKAKGVDKAYADLYNKIKEMQDSTDTLDTVKTKLGEIMTELSSHCALFKIQPQIVKNVNSLWPYLPINIETNDNKCGLLKNSDSFDPNNDWKTNPTRFAYIPMSYYTVDFTELANKIQDASGVSVEALSQEKEQKVTYVQQQLLDQYLTFNSSLVYITKSLWAHVETFLDMCLKTKINIIGSPRTVKDLNLTRENSNLPKAYYNDDKLRVPPFPVILENQQISGTNNSRCVLGWLGKQEIAPNAPEVGLVTSLLHGAAEYWTWTHSGSGETTTKADVNIYNDGNEGIDDIRKSVYSYLRNIFEKWIHSMSTESNTVQNEWGIEKYFNNHFLFIDTFYNKIGEGVGINVEKFAEACHDIFNHKTNTLMSFMTDYMQQINTILQPTQGFMLNELEDEKNIISYYDKIFSPIPFSKMSQPDSAPYFVVIYRGEPSKNLDIGNDKENEDDSFMISMDDNQEEVPVGLRDKDITKGQGYIIPAIGVSYGKQYQNYFMDVKVNTTKPAANEVSIAAQYDLAGVSTAAQAGGNEQSMRLGQDLYTVYANNSYQCTVTMMGCMWIQPLMYFQLNNVPMFRGTYMIQQVTHNISVGNMTTEFTGVRMSKYSSPFVNSNLIYNQNSEALLQEAREKAAEFDNDCPYHYFDPNDEGGGLGTNTFTQTWLDTPFGTNFPPNCVRLSDKKEGFAVSKWYAKVKGKKTKYAIASIIYKENNGDKLSRQLHAAMIFNQINHALGKGKGKGMSKRNMEDVWQGHNWCAIRDAAPHLDQVLDYLDGVNDSDKIVQDVVEVFTKSPCAITGTTNGNGDNGMDLKVHISSSNISRAALQSIYYTGDVGSTRLFAHKGSCYFSYNKPPERTGCYFWEPRPEEPKDDNKKAPEKFGKKLLECIQQTFNFNNTMSENNKNFDSYFNAQVNASNQTFTFSLKTVDKESNPMSARLIDILLNTYNRYISIITCTWESDKVSNIGTDTNPTTIVASFSITEISNTMIGFTYQNKYIVISEGSFPTDIFKVLKKKYNSLTDKKANAYIFNQIA